MKQLIVVLALGILAACGASPTAPTPTVTHPPPQTTAEPPPAADPPATPPAPTPAPAPTPTPAPTPSPAPTPTPAPTPPARTILHASVASSHWYPDAAFTLPASFDVVIEGDTAKIAALDPFPFGYFISADDFIVKQKDFEFVVQGGRFTFNGLAGQATGPIAAAK